MTDFDTLFVQLQEYVKLTPPANEKEGRKIVKEFFTNGDHGWTYSDFHNGLTRQLYEQGDILQGLFANFNPKEAN